jgi:hypothetical protein
MRLSRCHRADGGSGSGRNPTSPDLCPGTIAAEVDATGCAKEQIEAGVGGGILIEGGEGKTPEQVAREILEDPPETGQITNGYYAITVDAGNAPTPMVFHTHESNVVELPESIHVTGNLLLATPLGHIAIAEADLIFERSGTSIERIHGTAVIPFPAIGMLEGFEASDLIHAELGFDYGSTLAHLDAPLVDDRKYLFFAFSAALEISNGPFTFSAPGAEDALVILDPSDPMFFMRGSLLGLGAVGPIEDAAIGVSLNGLLPYSAMTTLTAPELDFDGHLYLSGSFPLTRLPMTIEGELVVDLAPSGNIPSLTSPELRYGSNGTLNLTADFLEVFTFEAYLGSSSTVITLTEQQQDAFFAGIIAPDRSFLNDVLPIRHDDSLGVEGRLSSNLEQSHLLIQGRYTFDGQNLGGLVGLDLADLLVAQGTISIDKNGFFLTGTLDAGAELLPNFRLGANSIIEAQFADDPSQWFVSIRGSMNVSGYELIDASARIDSNGIAISGMLDTGISMVVLTGRIDSSGFLLSGEATVSLPISAGQEVVEWVTDAAICGYNVVRDGALCGYEVVTDGAVCGYEVVTDGAVCGFDSITDAAICGSDFVANGAVCGTEYVTDGVRCGWDEVWSEVCSQDWLSWICDDVLNYEPRSCNVDASCDVPRTCTDYSAPRTCTNFNLPMTCEDLSRPKACEDLSSPATCEHHSIIPDYHFGDFNGRIALSLGTSGLAGQVSGDYCLTSGSCTTLFGGRLALGDPLEACIDIPGGLGEFCAPF